MNIIRPPDGWQAVNSKNYDLFYKSQTQFYSSILFFITI